MRARQKNKDEQAAVENAHPSTGFEVAHLRGRKVIVKDNGIGISFAGNFSKFVDFARTDLGGWIEFVAALQYTAHFLKSGGVGQMCEFYKRVSGFVFGDAVLGHANENGTSYVSCVKDVIHGAS